MNTEFLGLQIDKRINWKNDIEQMIPKLSGACYAISSMVHISNINTQIKLLYVLPFCYKIWNNFLGGIFSNSGKIFILQKKIFRIMAGGQPRTSCGKLIKQLEILPVQCQYILLLMNFIINNQQIF